MEVRLSPLDTSFLRVESSTAHMHVGWIAFFEPPPDRAAPSFEDLRRHVAARLARAPRYRQRLAEVPQWLNQPVWVDDERFDLDEHVIHTDAEDIWPVVDAVLSVPLRHDRPLWELWIADRLADGRIGVIGKAHHCMVDGIAAVELASLLLDDSPDPPQPPADSWSPRRAPRPPDLLGTAVRDRVREAADLVRTAAGLAGRPGTLLARVRRSVGALGSSITPAPADDALNRPISPDRRLVPVARELDELRAVAGRFGCTVNDVVLAAAAGALRRFLLRRGAPPHRLKAMVPANVRASHEAGALGNRISFMFITLPCDEPDPERRILNVQAATTEAKRRGHAEGGDTVLQAFGYAPRTLQSMVARLVASPRTFNLVVSNIPGPTDPMWMAGCELIEAYPVVPLADRHALAIGMTSVRDGAYFGLYVDRAGLGEAGELALELDTELDDLVELAEAREPEPALV